MLKNLKVLLIEDDAEDALLIKRDFKKNRALEILHATNLKDGISLGETQNPDVVILDLTLPDSEGLDNVKIVREALARPAIVILTGLNDEQIGVEAIQLGAQEYFVKGEITEGMLARTIRFAYENRRLKLQLENLNFFLEGRIEERGLKLRQTENRLSLLVESVTDYAIITLGSNGEIASWNFGAKRIFGYETDYILGKSFTCLFTQEDIKKNLPKIFLKGAQDCGRSSFDLILQKENGELFESHSVITPLRGEAIPGFAFVVRDISELSAASARVMQAERLATIGRTVAGLAHESRNALQRIQSSVNKIVRRSKDFPEVLPFTRDIEKAVDDLKLLYDTVKKFAAPISLRIDQINLNKLFKAVQEELSPTIARREVEFLFQASDETNFQGDEFRFKQIFRNLIENSLDAAKDPVRIQINQALNKKTKIPSLLITYCDNGPGLEEDVKEKIFRPFFTTKTHGTGLGMSIVKRIIDEHGGSIEATNALGIVQDFNGACFKIEVPLEQRQKV
ncbi:MAG: response regulator [Bdellovibrionales bacterium]|nr:response regulator [Bdellovibrionales bacterium]